MIYPPECESAEGASVHGGASMEHPFSPFAMAAAVDLPPKIILLDDDAEMRAMLERYLSGIGFLARSAADSPSLDRMLARETFDVLVLDVMMPGEDGLSVCRRLRAQGETIPILMLTARGETVDRILGLEMGADDYLPKPFAPRELASRLNAMVRRSRMAHPVALQEAACTRFGVYEIDFPNRRVVSGNKVVTLSTAEFALLKVFATHPGRALGRDRLIDLAKGRQHGLTERSVDVQVMRLRRLIEEDHTQPVHIQTVWGIGYQFNPCPQP